MKKLLGTLGAIGLVASTGVSSVVSCGTPKNDNSNNNNNDNTSEKISMDDIMNEKSVNNKFTCDFEVNKDYLDKPTLWSKFHEGEYWSEFLADRSDVVFKTNPDSELWKAVSSLEDFFSKDKDFGNLIVPENGKTYNFTDLVINSFLSDQLNIKEGTYSFVFTFVARPE